MAHTVSSAQTVAVQETSVSTNGNPAQNGQSINDWLLKMHEASLRKRSYVGTMVQSQPQSANVAFASARIWHACDGAQQMERVETLTGAPRSTFRHNDRLVTFMSDSKVVRVEKREPVGGFPELLKPGAGSIPEFYAVRAVGQERVAGLDSDVVQLVPKDTLRFGYRIWTERKSNLVVKLQTLDANGVVLEQAAFSELQLDAPVKMEKISAMMAATDGYKIERPELTKTTAAAEGWILRSSVPGFKALNCYKRGTAPAAANVPSATPLAASSPAEATLQWLFSDGLATVSLFVETYDKSRHTVEGAIAMGATNTLMRRVNDYWLSAVGEVPPQTLKAFATALERKK